MDLSGLDINGHLRESGPVTAPVRLSASALSRRLGQTCLTEGPEYRRLADRIRTAVLDGRITLDSVLPSERDLAGGMQLSRTTVASAYALLREEGWLVSRRGSGSRVALPEGPSRGTEALVRPAAGSGPRGLFGHPKQDGPDRIDLTTASLPAATEPFLAALAAATAALPAYLASDGYSPLGLPVLRAAIAARYTAAGVPTRPEQILVTNGAQHAFSIALQELSHPGDRVLVECPTYPVALDAIRTAGRLPAAFGLLHRTSPDESPWDLELLETTLRQSAPRLGYLIPDFQNPTGALMAEADRQRLVRAATHSGTVLLIDESFRDTAFAPDTLPLSMGAFGDDARVVLLGSLSKAFWGGLRIGWIRTSPALIDRMALTRSLGDMAGAVLDQLIAVELLSDPGPALQVQQERLRSGAEAVLDALAEFAPAWRPTVPTGGASLWIQLPGPISVELARSAAAVGVFIAPGPRFGPDGTMESFLRIPFTRPADRLREAVRRLAAIDVSAPALRPGLGTGFLT